MRMKKIFTSVLLVVVSLFITTPVVGQQLSEKDKVAIAKAVVPAMIGQVSQISGLDLEGMQNPNIDLILHSPLFGKQTSLRASASTISIQPDSALLNLSDVVEIDGSLSDMIQGALSSVKLTFADYKSLSLATAAGRIYNVNLPLKTTASFTVMGIMPVNINLNIALSEEKTGLLPFGTLTAAVDLGFLETVGLKGGELFTLKESASNGIYVYDISLGEVIRTLMDKEDAPNFKAILDLVSMAAEVPVAKVALQSISDKATFTTNEAAAYFNAKSLASSKIVVDSIVAISYNFENNVTTKDFAKIVYESKKGEDSKTVEFLTTLYDKESESASWEWFSADKYVVSGNHELDPNNLIPSVLSNVIEDLKNLKANSGESLSVVQYSFTENEADVADNEKGEPVLELIATPEIVDMQTVKMVIDIAELDDDGTKDVSQIAVTLPLKDETISIEFLLEEDDEMSSIATIYLKSNLMGVVTSNETIKQNVQDIKVLPSNGSILIKNGKGNYMIVNMLGQAVATGKITSEEQYINMPNVPKGIYMISIFDGAKRKTVKFIR